MPATNWLSAEEVASSMLDAATIVVDVDVSTRYRPGHMPGSH